jgi:hypothetical protein
MSQCVQLDSGRPMLTFYSKADARRHAKKYKKKHRKLVPYLCVRCDKWHLRTRSNDEYYRVCSCRDHRGYLKRAYLDHNEVEVVCEKLNAKAGRKVVEIYDCIEYYDVWHLTGIGKKK